MKQYHDGYHLGIGQRAVTVVLPFRLVPLGSESVNLDKSVINVAEVIRHTENFSNSGKLSLVPYTKDFGRITHF